MRSFIILQKKLENVCLCLVETYLNTELSLLEGCADVIVLLDYHRVKRVCERNY